MKTRKYFLIAGVVLFCLLVVYSNRQVFADLDDVVGVLVEQKQWERKEVPSNQDADKDNIVFEQPVTVYYEERTYAINPPSTTASAKNFFDN
ncbi:MAG: hypothetical protein CSA11_11030 [Chloroflexi bacterium]|nr:MAG: hypothetical protein CSA11_11030 [Chloroflexota bacterium]